MTVDCNVDGDGDEVPRLAAMTPLIAGQPPHNPCVQAGSGHLLQPTHTVMALRSRIDFVLNPVTVFFFLLERLRLHVSELLGGMARYFNSLTAVLEGE